PEILQAFEDRYEATRKRWLVAAGGRTLGDSDHRMMKIALTVLVIITASPLAGGTLPQSAKVLFPNQDDQNEYTGSGNGCDLPPQLLEPLQRLVSTSFRQNYVRYDIARLNSKHV